MTLSNGDAHALIDSKATHEIDVYLYEIGHYDLRIVQWRAREMGLGQDNDWVAYRPTGVKYDDRGAALISMQIKVFTTTEMDSIEHYVAPEWDVTDGVS